MAIVVNESHLPKHVHENDSRASVAIRKFARILSLLQSELPNQSDTSNCMILVSLLNPKFAKVVAEQSRELRVLDTSPIGITLAVVNLQTRSS